MASTAIALVLQAAPETITAATAAAAALAMEDTDELDAWQLMLEEHLESLDSLPVEHFASCMENC